MLLREYLRIRNNGTAKNISVAECKALGFIPGDRGWLKPHLSLEIPEEIVKGLAWMVIHATWSKQSVKRNLVRFVTPCDEAFNKAKWTKVRDGFFNQITNPVCLKCGVKEFLQVDHKLPKAVFPSLAYDPRNFQILCRKCNLSKGVEILPEYLLELKHLL